MTRHFLRDDDLSPAEQAEVLALAATLKRDRHAKQPFAGPQGVAIIFDKPTLRTQLSFTTGVAELGGYPMVVDGNLAQIGTRESIADVARGGDDGADGLGGDVLTEVERRLVAMLSSGMTDEAMARAIGLSHRTVQRRLADLARRVGAEGRFQLGVQAARRGWV